MITFQDVEALDYDVVQNLIDYPVRRVELVREDDVTKHVNREAVLEFHTDRRLGIVNSNRMNIEYPELMNWTWGEMQKTGVPFKLKDSLITQSGDLYQEYIFDYVIDTPDNEGMAPLVILKGSHVRKPLELFFGTYRFVCSNGVMVGETIRKISINSNIKDLIKTSITDDIRIKFGEFAKVSQLYTGLEARPFTDYLYTMIADQYLGTKIKKEVLNLLVSDGDITVTKEKIRSSDLARPDHLINIVNEINAWAFYNVVTSVATFQSKSVHTRTKNFERVSNIFGV